LQAFIFISYLILSIYLLTAIPFFKNSGLKPWQIVSLFCLKVLAGVAYALFYTLPKYAEGSDTWRFYRLSLKEKQWLLQDPIAFVKDLFVYGYDRSGGLFAGENSYWNDLKSNVPVKLLAVMNVLSGDRYYTNIIFFNLLFFIGLVALFKFFNHLFPDRKLLIVAGIFLLPSTLFWCSGIHKDGLLLSALGLITYFFNKGILSKFKFSYLLIIVVCLVLIFSLRNYLALALIPALLCWWLSIKYSLSKKGVFVIAYSLGLLLFFTLKYVHPSLNFPQYIVEKQSEFSKLDGASTVAVGNLEPTLFSFIKFLPSAIDMAFLRPHITEAISFSHIPAVIENMLLLVIVLITIIFFRQHAKLSPGTLFCLFFSLSILLLSGYTITLSGAIVRYRSIALPFLITPLLGLIDIKTVKEQWFAKRKFRAKDDGST
jgi:hypothetical protein